MSPNPEPDAAQRLSAYIARLRFRAVSFYALRALCAAIGAGAAALVLAAAAAGPVVTPTASRALLAGLCVIVLAVLAIVLWPARRLRGLGGCSLIATRAPALAARVRSALELRQEPATMGSAELIAAHARSVDEAVRVLPVNELVPTRWLSHPSVLAGLSCAALSGIALLASDGLRAGAGALLRPAELREDGLRVAKVIGGVSAKLLYPSYLERKPETLRDPLVIEAPRGTTVELTITPRMASQQGLLQLGAAPTRLRGAPGGSLFGRFVVRDDAPLSLRVLDDGQWYEDAQARRVHAIEDKRPEVELRSSSGTTVEVSERIALHGRARDDHALQTVELAVRIGDRDETRTRLWSALNSQGKQLSYDAETVVSPAELGAQPGDTVLVWLEGRDGDTVSGPNVGVSKALTFEIATDAQQLSLRLPQLREVLDGSLEALADRLESAVPEAAALAARRVTELRQSYDGWLSDLDALLAAGRSQSYALDFDQLEGVADRMRRELGREAGLARNPTRAPRAFVDTDARIVSEHERDVLLIADLLAQGLVDEARQLTQELGALKDHIKELLEQLKKNRTPEGERALLAEIAKAQRRLRELAQSLSRLANRVPSEFINREALPQGEARNALDDLKAAVESGDLGSAEEQLAALEREIDSLREHIEQGGTRFREAHSGARDRALAQAQGQLDQLAAEQGRLSQRTRDIVKRAAERQGEQQNVDPELGQEADGIQRDLEALQRSSPGSAEAPFLDRAQARMRDAADALRTGDISEARRMAQNAGSNLEHAASSLEQDARMFPGPHGETSQRAKAANDAAASLGKLQQRLERAMPDLGQAVGEGERQQMRGDVEPQRGAREKAESIGGQLGGGEGTEQSPLSPRGERGLRQAADAMRRAERSLERGNAQQAALDQDDAGERLRQVSEELARKQQGGEGQGGQQGGRGQQRTRGDGGRDPSGPVRIHGADEFAGPVQMRRKLLDAMREQAPAEYEPAVQRYYRELLR